MLSFGTVIAAKNISALKDFTTFLFNYEIHERPTWLEKKIIEWSKVWIEKLALKQFRDLQEEVKPNTINLSLNDCSTAMFTVLYLANQQNNVSMERERLVTGKEIFMTLANMELEFERIKKGNIQALEQKYGDK